MDQKIPTISDEDIKRIVSRDFPQIEFDKVMAVLSIYESESNNGMNRVYASILKLSNGNYELLKKYAEKAKSDYRDVISLSEYPNYSAQAFNDNLPDKMKKELIHRDWVQYEAWLLKQ